MFFLKKVSNRLGTTSRQIVMKKFDQRKRLKNFFLYQNAFSLCLLYWKFLQLVNKFFLIQWKKKEKPNKKKKKHKLFSYYLTEKQAKSKQRRRELFKSIVSLYSSVRKQTLEPTVNILLERSWQTFYCEEGNNG